MRTADFQADILVKKNIQFIDQSIKEYLNLFFITTQLEQLDFYFYHYNYNDYIYDYTISENEDKEPQSRYSIVLQDENVLFGKITFNQKIKSTPIVKKILSLINKKLFEKQNLLKKEIGDESNLNFYIVSNETTANFAKDVRKNLSVMFNASITKVTTLKSIVKNLNLKRSKNIVIYITPDYETINSDKKLIESLNEFIIVYGPNEHKISLLCGTMQVHNYITYEDYNTKELKSLIMDTKNVILNKFSTKNSIIAFCGISGGVGCTTIAMNTANILAEHQPSKNILFIDLSNTKAISNLFLDQNPLPEKSILDLVNSNEFDLENNLNNGLVKIRENFYAINGIQKHIDKDYLEKDVFTEKLLGYLSKASEYFNTIIIDTGVFEATNLKTTIYDISNSLELIIEMNLPNASKLKTLYNLIKRAGLKEKFSFIVNRLDSECTLSTSDAHAILNLNDEDKFQYSISNNFSETGRCWNNCELVSNVYPDSIFTKELLVILKEKELLDPEEKIISNKSLFSFFSRKKL